MRVALRHTEVMKGASATQVLEFGELKLDLARREVFRGEQELHLTPIEYKLLVLLAQNAGKVLTYRQILTAVWGRPVRCKRTTCEYTWPSSGRRWNSSPLGRGYS
jgi:two-component system KDP operon response regulator KdpE